MATLGMGGVAISRAALRATFEPTIRATGAVRASCGAGMSFGKSVSHQACTAR